MDAVGSYYKQEFVHLRNIILPEPRQPIAQLFQLICPLHARRPCMQWAGGKGLVISLK